MSVWTTSARTGLVALVAGFSLHCSSCEDNDSRRDATGDAASFGDIGAPSVPGWSDEYDEQTGVGLRTLVPEQRKMDILFVIDNSGSMCEEQEGLRRHFTSFANRLVDQGIDFNLGVTTTQMNEYAHEPTAEPGTLQSEPQPLPSALSTCHGDEGDPNDPNDGFAPIREAINTAIGCTEDPAQWAHLSDVTDDEIACAVRPSSDQDCDERPRREGLFPTADEDGNSPYRQVPRVIRSTEYNEADKVEVERLSRDFACVSFVGTSGYAVEKGLGAAVLAVSPEMTGGPIEAPVDASAPNHGLIRREAEFGLVFLTDENDCTHDGTLDENTSCGGDVCAFANHPDFPNSPLIEPSALAEEFVANLSASKERSVTTEEVTVASIHGQWRRYGATPDYPSAEVPTNIEEYCTELPDEAVQEKSSCSSPAGVAYSGDRYERFTRNFSRVYPELPEDPNAHMPGLVCQPERIADTLDQVGQTSTTPPQICLTRELYSCGDGQDAGACPAYRFSDEAPGCMQDAQSRWICDSAVELQLIAPSEAETPADLLASTGYCAEGSIRTEGLARGCVIDRSRFSLTPCSEGVSIEWHDEASVAEDLDGFQVRARYLTDAYTD